MFEEFPKSELDIFFVGTYTVSPGKGEGIYSCSLEPDGSMRILEIFKAIPNPSYVILDRPNKRLYAVHEAGTDSAAVSALSYTDDYKLRLINTQKVPGSSPCHLALDPSGEYLTVANYSSGNVVMYGIEADGSLSELKDNVQHAGKSVNAARQEGPHAHSTVFGPEAKLWVADLGTDEVKGYGLAEGKLREDSSTKLAAGAGPRHMVFSPDGKYLFVVNELDSTVSLLRHQQGALSLLTSISTLPHDFTGESYCAAIRIHPNGKFVYASNRGHDSIAVLEFDEEAETLTPVQYASTIGNFPRDFALTHDAKMLITSNQHSHDLYSYNLNGETGKLEPTGEKLEIGSPVCVCMV
ncbi:MAG: lactonase family protein [Trueperaceae bacterium]|nr:lactonase family protein [Trueperaceae bacterium]